jgi:hypothetical protein
MRITESALRKIVREEISSQLFREAIDGKMTVGDLRDTLKAIKKVKGSPTANKVADVSKALGGAATDVASEIILSAIPGAGLAKAVAGGAFNIFSAAKGSPKPKDKKAMQLWDLLTIDPQTQQLLDDKIVDEFIEELDDIVTDLPDEADIPDADVQLQNFLKADYGKNLVNAKR